MVQLASRLRRPMLWVIAGVELVHLCTLFPGVGGRVNHGDSAKFQFVGKVLGVSHPPGNPLYLLLNAAFVRLPHPWRPATQVALLSTLFGGITLAFVYRTLDRIAGAGAAVLGTVALGLGPLFWTFATEAEVYTLNTALLAAAVHYAARFAHDGSRQALLRGAFFFSLGFANHLTSVSLLPAFLWLAYEGARSGAHLGKREVLTIAGFAALSASLYAYVPWRVLAGARYSELASPLGWQELWDYLTAADFQGHFGDFSFPEAVRDRVPGFLRYLQKQWLWPVLVVLPLGMARLRAWSPAFGSFLVLAASGITVFAIGYAIPDPEGFYMPIVTLLALPLGLGASALLRESLKARALFTVLALCIAASAFVHVLELRHRDGYELVEKMGAGKKFILWDLDDAFARIPAGARFVVPCDHYGCVEVLNYFRLADEVVARRKIVFVRPPDVRAEPWKRWTAPLEDLDFENARATVVCSLRPEDAEEMSRRGIAVTTLTREAKHLRGAALDAVPITCSAAVAR